MSEATQDTPITQAPAVQYMDRSAEIGTLAKALSRAQSTIKSPLKNKTNPHFGSKYADLDSIMDVLRPVLAECELAIPCCTVVEYNGIAAARAGVSFELMHSSGQFIRGVCLMPLVGGRADAQAIGSAQTYSLRYVLRSMFLLPGEDDDDGNSLQKGAEPRQAQAKPAPAGKAVEPPKPRVPTAAEKLTAVRTSIRQFASTMVGGTDAFVAQATKLVIAHFNEALKDKKLAEIGLQEMEAIAGQIAELDSDDAGHLSAYIRQTLGVPE